MRNGSMFRTLHNYEKVNFAENHRYIYIYTPDAILTYRIFAVYKGDAGHILLEYDFSDNRVKENYISTICASGENYGILYDDVDISTESKILTLSTCTGEDDSRFIVQAVQIDSIPAK
jgi:sortase B